MDEAVGVAGPCRRLGGEYLDRHRPTDRVDPHHLSLCSSPPCVREDGADDTLGAGVS